MVRRLVRKICVLADSTGALHPKLETPHTARSPRASKTGDTSHRAVASCIGNELFGHNAEQADKPALRFWSKAKDDQTRFLSNFSPPPFRVGDKRYDTVEHYYQSRKLERLGLSELAEKARTAATPDKAKSAGGKGATRKFQQNPQLAAELVATADEVLGETRRRAGRASWANCS